MTTSNSLPPSEVFDQFLSATTFKSVLSTFRQLCELLHLKPTNINNFYPQLKVKLDSWRAASLWAKLDKRASHKCYNRGKTCPNTRVLLIGAGPCGLRAAIEAQLLGAKVVVVEKRDRFSRNNVLHLWPFVIHDLRNLGAKKFFGKFCAGSIDHISIRQLQLILLKVALLLGVEVHENVSFSRLKEPPEDQMQERIGWHACVDPADHPVSQYEFDVLIGADGKRNTLLGFNRKEFRGKLAIAVTANFINRHTIHEAQVAEISGVAFIFNQKFFQDMREQTGIDLENIVYYKDDTHYFVMTAKKQSLLDRGVIINDYNDTARLLSAENVNRESLLEYARDAANFATNFQHPFIEFAVNHYGQADVAMFDFTSMYAAENACRITERRGYKLLQGLVGDSLLEPFWPTGSGCARGFLSSFDAAWMIRSWASGKLTPLQVLAEREAIYRLLAQTTPENLSKDFNQYTLNPASRYPNLNLHSVLPSQVRSLYNTDGKIDEQILDAPVEVPKKKKRRGSCIHPDALLNWCQRQVALHDTVKIENFTTSWKNGLALCNILHRYRPDLIDVSILNSKDVAENNQLAFDICERELGIPPVMTGQEMANCEVPDKLSMISYLAQIYDTFRGEIPVVYKSSTDDRTVSPNRQPFIAPRSVLAKISNKLQNKRKYSLDKESIKEKADSMRRSRHPLLIHKRRSKEKDKGIALDLISNEVSLTNFKTVPEMINVGTSLRKESINSRAKFLEMKMQQDAGLKRQIAENSENSKPAHLRAAHAELNIKLIQEQLQKSDSSKGDKKSTCPKVGKLRKDDWNVKLLEDKVSKQEKPVPKPIENEKSKILQEIYLNKDLHAEPISQTGGSEICFFCKKRVYLMERSSAEGLFFHRTCFKCEYCGTSLRLGNYSFDKDFAGGGKFYCRSHFRMQKPDHRWQEMMKRKQAFLSTAYNEQEKEKIYTTLLANTEKALSPNRQQKEDIKEDISVTDAPSTTPTFSETHHEDGMSSLLQEPANIFGRDQTPERVEYENSMLDYSEEELLTSELEEEELTQKNLGPSQEFATSDDEYSNFSSDSESDEEAYAEELERSLTADETRKLAERWQQKYSIEHSLMDSDGSSAEGDGLSDTEVCSEDGTSDDIDSDEEYNIERTNEENKNIEEEKPTSPNKGDELTVEVPVITRKDSNQYLEKESSTESDISDESLSSGKSRDHNTNSDTESDSESSEPEPLAIAQIPTIVIDESPPQIIDQEQEWSSGTHEISSQQSKKNVQESASLDKNSTIPYGTEVSCENSNTQNVVRTEDFELASIKYDENSKKPQQSEDASLSLTHNIGADITLDSLVPSEEYAALSDKVATFTPDDKKISDGANGVGVCGGGVKPVSESDFSNNSVNFTSPQSTSIPQAGFSEIESVDHTSVICFDSENAEASSVSSDLNLNGSLNCLINTDGAPTSFESSEKEKNNLPLVYEYDPSEKNADLIETTNENVSGVSQNDLDINKDKFSSLICTKNNENLDSSMDDKSVNFSHYHTLLSSKNHSSQVDPCNPFVTIRKKDRTKNNHDTFNWDSDNSISLPWFCDTNEETSSDFYSAILPENSEYPQEQRQSISIEKSDQNVPKSVLVSSKLNDDYQVKKTGDICVTDVNSSKSANCISHSVEKSKLNANAYAVSCPENANAKNDKILPPVENELSIQDVVHTFADNVEVKSMNNDILCDSQISNFSILNKNDKTHTQPHTSTYETDIRVPCTMHSKVTDKEQLSEFSTSQRKIPKTLNLQSSHASESFKPLASFCSTPVKPQECEAIPGKSGVLTPISENGAKLMSRSLNSDTREENLEPNEKLSYLHNNSAFSTPSHSIKVVNELHKDTTRCASSPNLSEKLLVQNNKTILSSSQSTEKSFDENHSVSSESSTEKSGKHYGYSGSFAEKIRPKHSTGDTIYLRSLDINLQKQQFSSLTKSSEKLSESNGADEKIWKKLFHGSDKSLSHKTDQDSVPSLSCKNFKRQSSVPLDSVMQPSTRTPTTSTSTVPCRKGLQSSQQKSVILCEKSKCIEIDPVSPYSYSQNRPVSTNIFPVKVRPKCEMNLTNLQKKREHRKSVHENIQGLPFADEEKAVTPSDVPSTPDNVFDIVPPSFKNGESSKGPLLDSDANQQEQLLHPNQSNAQELARKEARARARLKSDEELGLSPKNYRKKYQRQLSLSSIYYDELTNDEFYDNESEDIEDETLSGTSNAYFFSKKANSESDLSDLGESNNHKVEKTSSGKNNIIPTQSMKEENCVEGPMSIQEIENSRLFPSDSDQILQDKYFMSGNSQNIPSYHLSSMKRISPECLTDEEKLKSGNKKQFFSSILNFGKNHVSKEKKDQLGKNKMREIESDRTISGSAEPHAKVKQKPFSTLKLNKSKDRPKEKHASKQSYPDHPEPSFLTDHSIGTVTAPLYTKNASKAAEPKSIKTCAGQTKVVPKYTVYRNPGTQLTAVPSHVTVDKVKNGLAPKASEDSFSDTEDEVKEGIAAKNVTMVPIENDKDLKENKMLKCQRQLELKLLFEAQEIHRKLGEIEVQQKELEQRGVEIEKALRGEGTRPGNESDHEQEWYRLVHSRSRLAREEKELHIRFKDLELVCRQSHLQQEMTRRMAENDLEKNSSQISEEGQIVLEMLKIVEERNKLLEMLNQLKSKKR